MIIKILNFLKRNLIILTSNITNNKTVNLYKNSKIIIYFSLYILGVIILFYLNVSIYKIIGISIGYFMNINTIMDKNKRNIKNYIIIYSFIFLSILFIINGYNIYEDNNLTHMWMNEGEESSKDNSLIKADDIKQNSNKLNLGAAAAAGIELSDATVNKIIEKGVEGISGMGMGIGFGGAAAAGIKAGGTSGGNLMTKVLTTSVLTAAGVGSALSMKMGFDAINSVVKDKIINNENNSNVNSATQDNNSVVNNSSNTDNIDNKLMESFDNFNISSLLDELSPLELLVNIQLIINIICFILVLILIILILNKYFSSKILSGIKNISGKEFERYPSIVKSNVAIASAVTAYARICMLPYKLLSGTIYTTDKLDDSLVGRWGGLILIYFFFYFGK
jgi:hypothetical protein